MDCHNGCQEAKHQATAQPHLQAHSAQTLGQVPWYGFLQQNGICKPLSFRPGLCDVLPGVPNTSKPILGHCYL